MFYFLTWLDRIRQINVDFTIEMFAKRPDKNQIRDLDNIYDESAYYKHIGEYQPIYRQLFQRV